MALHIQMSEEAEAELRKSAMVNQLSSIAASLVFMVLGGLILYFSVILIAGESPVEFLAYSPPVEDAPPTDKPVTPELSQKQQTPSSDVAPSLIVANAPAAVAMAHVEMDTADLEESSDFGIGLDIGGLGDGLGSGGSGLGSGQKGGSALEGTLYDLKQTRAGSPNQLGKSQQANGNLPPASCHALVGIMNGFMKSWNAAALNKYWQAPTKLYASSFYLPTSLAAYAPKAFKAENRMKPSGWCAVYRGRVRAPKTGKFRFVGTGDELLAVRFNHKMVLEAGYRCPSRHQEDNPSHAWISGTNSKERQAYLDDIKSGRDRIHAGYEFIQHPDIPIWNREVGGLTAGTEFSVKEGETYPIEVLIYDQGGKFGFVLFIQDITDSKDKARRDNFDLFRTNFSEPNKEEISRLLNQANCAVEGIQCPKYRPDSPIWVAVP